MATFSEIAKAQEDRIADLEFQISEHLGRMNRLFSKNWVSLLGGFDNRDDGPDLDQLHEASNRAREMAALDGIVKNGLKVKTAYVWRENINIAGVAGARQGRGVNVKARMDQTINQRNFFGPSAKEELEAALYCDSQPFIVGDTDDYTLRQIPISEITDDLRNPEYAGEVWAYRRKWIDYTADPNNGKTEVEWIYTYAFESKIPTSSTVSYKGVSEPIAKNKRMFGEPINSNSGWGYGLPDVVAAIKAAGEYDASVNAGLDVTEGLAKIIGQIKNNDAAGAASVAVKFGNNNSSGNLGATGQNNDITMFQTAGTAYDFNKLLPVLARFAAGIGVSVIEISANPGNAGGSYGAARSMTPVTEAMTTMRRKYWVSIYRQVLVWMGADAEKLDVWFEPIMPITDRYRAEQLIELRLGTGLYKGEAILKMHAILDGRNPDLITEKDVPEGWLIPNNKESIELRTIDPNTSGSAAGGNPANGGGLTPTQGSGAKTNKTGSGDQKADDIRGQREADLQRVLDELKADELIEALRRVEAKLDGE